MGIFSALSGYLENKQIYVRIRLELTSFITELLLFYIASINGLQPETHGGVDQ